MGIEPSQPETQDGPRHSSRFVTTSWTAVAAAARPDTEAAKEALGKLCQTYWQPLHDYLRRLGYREDDAKDLTQEFFYRLLSKNTFHAADRERGKFRTFLLTSLKNFVVTDWHRKQAAKRGGGKSVVSVDDTNVDGLEIPASDDSPEVAYQLSWAKQVIQEAQARLSEEFASAGKTSLFKKLQPFLETSTNPRAYQAVASSLNMTPNAIGVTVHRMRQRLGDLIRSEIQRTLVHPTSEEIDAEMRFLMETLGR